MKQGKTAAWAAKLAVKVLAVVLLLAFVMYVNYTVDPGKLFQATSSNSVELTAAAIILKGANAANLGNYNERLIKRVIARDGPAYSTLIFGSSRGAMITAEMVGDPNAMNLSVTGGTLDDFLGLFGVYMQNHETLPERVVVCVDPWLFNDNFQDPRFAESLGDGYHYTLTQLLGRDGVPDSLLNISAIYQKGEEVGFFDLGFDTCKQIISIPYFQTAVSSLFSENIDMSGVREIRESDDDFGALRSDGSYCYPLDYRNSDQDTVNYRAGVQLPNNMLGYDKYDTATGEKYALLRDFVAYLRGNGVRVDFIVLPIHPIIYMQVFSTDKYHPYIQTDSVLADVAAEYGCNIVGALNPMAVDTDETDFLDGYHYKPYVGEQLAALLPEWEG